MKRTLLLLFAVMIHWTMISAQVHQSTDQGYVFVTNLKTYSQKSLKSRVKTTIAAGRVAIAGEDGQFIFPCIDALEYIVLGSGTFHKYYPLAQDEVPPEYISSAAFDKAVRKVSISNQIPTSWELGKVYSLKPASPNEDDKSVTVRLLRISGNDVTLVTKVDDNFHAASTISLSGETVVEIAIDSNKVYFYNGQQIVLASNDSDETDYLSLVVDDKGITYSQNEEGVRRPNTKLSYVFGEYPEVEYFGWINDKEIVVDDILYVAKP